MESSRSKFGNGIELDLYNNLTAELVAYQVSDKVLKEKLLQEKERSYALEQTLNQLLYKLGNDADGKPLQNEEISSFARKLATLEMKELNERQRADHATMKYDQLRALVGELEKRNGEVEEKFAQISKLNLDLQRVERNLREQLQESIPADINRADKNLIKDLEAQESTLKLECHRLKEVAEVAQHQATSISLRQQCQEKELTSLRKQLYELQMETDEKTIIAKLHQHIIAMQVSESAAVRKYEVANNKLSKSEARLMKLQHLVDEKDEALQRFRSETILKTRYLKKTIQDLRMQYSGALTLGEQEKFSNTLYTLHEKKMEFELKLNEIKQKHDIAEHHAMELKAKNEGLVELIATLKDGQGAKKVAEWHSRMLEMKLEDMKLKRLVDSMGEKVSYLEQVNSKYENTVTDLEREIFNQAKEFENRQLSWEQHEVELERNIAKMEAQQKELGEAAKKFEEATGSIPDESLPVANQLELAIACIKQHIITIIGTRTESARMKERMEEAEEKFRTAETELVRKEKVINELRLRLPIRERDVTYKSVMEECETPTKDNPEAVQALKIAQTTVESLKIMLQKKDENIGKYQDMLKTSRDELTSQTARHQQEIKVLHDRLQLEIEEHVKKMKKVHRDYINAPQRELPSSDQIQRLEEIEEMLKEQDKSLAHATNKYEKAQKDMEKLKQDAAEAIEEVKQEKLKQKENHEMELESKNKELDDTRKNLREKELEVEVLDQELESTREANERAPSKTMKSLVERLRNQLAKKDKEQKALRQALFQIQSEMVSTAEENVKAHAAKMEDEVGIQQLIQKETSDLKSRIEDLEVRNDKLKKELKKKKDGDSSVSLEFEALKEDIRMKDIALKDLEQLITKQKKLLQEKKEVRQKVEKEVVKEPAVRPIEAFTAQTQGIDFTDLDDKPVKEAKPKDEVIRWEESKKWQKKVETLKTKLKEKSDECEKLTKTNGMLRDGFSRQEKDKLTLQNRLKSFSKGNFDQPTLSLQQEEVVADLKKRIFNLEEENNNLTRLANLDREKDIQELRMQNNQLNETVLSLQRRLDDQQESDHPGEKWSNKREEQMQREMLELRKENMELVFEKEQACKDVPRLRARVADLQGYVEVLKNEIETLGKKDRKRKPEIGTGMGGQSVEDMERVVAAMRRVFERLQVENESLKKETGKSKPRPDLSKENRLLKQELQRLKQLQASDNKKGQASASKSTSMVLQENEKLCRDLKKELEANEDLRSAKCNLEVRVEQLLKAIEKKNKALSEVGEKVDLKSSIKFHEEKFQAMKSDIEKKNAVLKDIKVHLRSAAEREADLLRQVDELEEKVSFLQQFPPGAQTENGAIKCLQQSRLKVKRLEEEKKELIFEANRLKELTNNGETPVDWTTQDNILSKLKNYDKMLALEVDLRTKIKVLEIEREKDKQECKKLKEELSAFEPAFFEELEDLKYNYKVSLERNVIYERQLKQFSSQFGVNINIPNDDNT